MKQALKGFTLIELMVTVTIAAVIITVAIPSLKTFYEQQRVRSNIEVIQNIVSFARNQAVSYGATVSVCPFASATSCGSTTDWSNGVRVFINANGADTELRAIDGFNDNDSVKGPAGVMTFSADGLSSAGEFIYCPAGESDSSRSITVSGGGLISYGPDGKTC
ncbi:GspH/FimT family pseudopilin [Shewanella sp. KT0246]|uniref:GspH/FimT family pseudopilin n=1 Tax=Shewanella sp. KT0246 TaxID=2815912 RepID=UPI001BBFDB1A|nr:GspH/FimT family pseudopilin [Shewanella sp. KT0246]GIU51626.1 type IV pilus biogenesis protein FimU [Shewanella sp. KT0246]